MFYDRFIELCEKRGVTPATVAKEIGLSNSVTTYWKRGSVPKADTIRKIANYFSVPISHLYGFNDTETMDIVFTRVAEYSPDAVIARLDNSDNDDDAEIHIDLTGGAALANAHKEAHELIDQLNSVGAVRVVGYIDELLNNPKYQKKPPQD